MLQVGDKVVIINHNSNFYKKEGIIKEIEPKRMFQYLIKFEKNNVGECRFAEREINILFQ